MASYIQGFDEERFTTKVNRNFLCLICFSVLKDPVLCPRNHHCFCRGCITKHLENYQRCPTCADELTVETLIEPPRMVKDYINELNIRCVYVDRGCQEIVQLQHLDQHEAACGFTPAVCTNPGCGATVNQRDFDNHENELCEFRKLKCHSCGEMTKTLANMEKKMANVEKDMAANEKRMLNVEKNMATSVNVINVEQKVENMEKNVTRQMANLDTKLVDVETHLGNVEKNVERNTADMERKLEAVNKEMGGIKTALVEAFNEMKDVLVKMEGKIEENTRKVRNTPSGDRENIIVAGGYGTDSVEIFNWRKRTWSPLQSMPKQRYGAPFFVYNNHVTIAGGFCCGNYVDDMIRMNIHPNPDLSMHWSDCPAKLPTRLRYHSSLVHTDHLIVSGGHNGNATSDCIHKVKLVPPYTVKTLSRMPEPRRNHCMQIFDGSLLIVGGSKTYRCQENLSSVVQYDLQKNEWKQLAPLPYDVSKMATVRWRDNIVVMGGCDKHDKTLDTVIIYNVKTQQCHMLPAMGCKRRGCAAVVFGNNIVVLGGWNGLEILKSVEMFNFESYTWQELPEMSKERCWHTAVVV